VRKHGACGARGWAGGGCSQSGVSSGGFQPEVCDRDVCLETFALGDLCAEAWCLWGARGDQMRLQPRWCEQRRLSA